MATLHKTVTVTLLVIGLLIGLTADTALASPPAQPPPEGVYHTVRWGETLSSIAERYGTTVEAIVQVNNIRNPSYIHAGVRLLIPTSSQPEQSPSEPSQAVTYTVRRGDNLTAIAARHGTTVEAITRANNIRNPSMIYVGMTLSIPAASHPTEAPAESGPTSEPSSASETTTEATPTPPPAPSPTEAPPPDEGPLHYTVKWGDTLTSIAQRYGTTVEAIVQANNVLNPSFIHAGVRLKIPQTPASAVQQAPAAPSEAATEPTVTPVPPPPVPAPPPVVQPTQLPAPAPPPVPVVALCHPQISITYPPVNAVLNGWGTTWIKGTADIDDFQFYKLEYGIGELPFEWFAIRSANGRPNYVWHGIGDVYDRRIVNGILGTWNTGALPEGVYQLRLVVVDNTGNYPPPCQLRVVVDHDAPAPQPFLPYPAPPIASVATPTPSPVAGRVTAPSSTPPDAPTPAPAPTPASGPGGGVPALCHPQINIAYPTVNAVLNGWGTTWIKGTADIDDFQFYKLEYGIGELPFEWFGIGDIHKERIINGIVGTWNTGALPEGAYQLRLVVVDNTGNYPPPCQVRVVVDHDAPAPQPFLPVPAPPIAPVATPMPSAVAGLWPSAPAPAPTPGPASAVGVPALCHPQINIAYPTVNAVLNGWGTTWIKGTADIDDFQFYKLEYGIGELPFEWFGIGDIHKERIINGIVGTWNTGALPEGAYQLRLVVVDNTGNYPPPCQVRVVIDHDAPAPQPFLPVPAPPVAPMATPVPSPVAGLWPPPPSAPWPAPPPAPAPAPTALRHCATPRSASLTRRSTRFSTAGAQPGSRAQPTSTTSSSTSWNTASGNYPSSGSPSVTCMIVAS